MIQTGCTFAKMTVLPRRESEMIKPMVCSAVWLHSACRRSSSFLFEKGKWSMKTKYISQNKITQIYSKTNIVYFKDLNNYINLTKNTIFICENDFDVQLLNIHQGKKFVYQYQVLINDILKSLNKAISLKTSI